MDTLRHTLKKDERLSSKLVIDKLFAGGNASMAAFPLRVVYMTVPRTEEAQPPVSIMVSVPKKRFRHAIDRNRMKRLVREAFRLNKHILWTALADKNVNMAVAFVCITNRLPDFHTVEKSMHKAMTRIAEKL